MRGNPPAFLFSLEKEAQAFWKAQGKKERI